MDKIKHFITLIPYGIIDAVKSVLRLVVLAIIPVIIAGINIQAGTVDVPWSIAGAVALFTALKFLDKLLHEMGKTEEVATRKESKLTKGLARF